MSDELLIRYREEEGPWVAFIGHAVLAVCFNPFALKSIVDLPERCPFINAPRMPSAWQVDHVHSTLQTDLNLPLANGYTGRDVAALTVIVCWRRQGTSRYVSFVRLMW